MWTLDQRLTFIATGTQVVLVVDVTMTNNRSKDAAALLDDQTRASSIYFLIQLSVDVGNRNLSNYTIHVHLA